MWTLPNEVFKVCYFMVYLFSLREFNMFLFLSFIFRGFVCVCVETDGSLRFFGFFESCAESFAVKEKIFEDACYGNLIYISEMLYWLMSFYFWF